MDRETERKIHQAAQVATFTLENIDDPNQQYQKAIIYKFADYLVEEWDKL